MCNCLPKLLVLYMLELSNVGCLALKSLIMTVGRFLFNMLFSSIVGSVLCLGGEYEVTMYNGPKFVYSLIANMLLL